MARARHLLLLLLRRRRFSTTQLAAPSKPHLPPLSPSLTSQSQSQPQTQTQTLEQQALQRQPSDPGGVAVDRLRHRIGLLSEKFTSAASFDALEARVEEIADEILGVSDVEDAVRVLERRSVGDLLRQTPNGFVSIELMSRLKVKPQFALKVFEWRRKQVDAGIPIVAGEYSKAIAIAGKTKNIDLAVTFFREAIQVVKVRKTCIYNALMVAYWCNGQISKAVSVFEEIQNNPHCKPTIITCNIILSVFGRSLLINQMESVLEIINKSDDLSPDLTTYNTIISGYITACMFDKMEGVFQRMEAGPVNPDVSTHLLMLRGYANSGNIEKMERTYELVKERVNNHKSFLIRSMIIAYCRSSDSNRVRKVENLIKFNPTEEYRSWLNVTLIRLYAQVGLVESMDKLIWEAFSRNTVVTTTGIMRTIISSYFNCGAVDLLAGFIRNAEFAGWRICRSLYHCKMVMYGKNSQLKEMHGVLNEMKTFRLNPTKKTFLIMYKAYLCKGRRYEAESIVGLMWKKGFLGL